MMRIALGSGLAGLFLLFSGPATADDMAADASLVPAVITIYAGSAKVAGEPGQQTLTLAGVHPIVLVAGNLGIERVYFAHDVADFHGAFNACQDYKEANAIANQDGTNAIVAYAGGPEGGDGYRAHSVLATADSLEDETMVTEGPAGTLRLWLDDAAYQETGNTHVFAMRGGTAPVGNYESVVLELDCFIPISGGF